MERNQFIRPVALGWNIIGINFNRRFYLVTFAHRYLLFGHESKHKHMAQHSANAREGPYGSFGLGRVRDGSCLSLSYWISDPLHLAEISLELASIVDFTLSLLLIVICFLAMKANTNAWLNTAPIQGKDHTARLAQAARETVVVSLSLTEGRSTGVHWHLGSLTLRLHVPANTTPL